MNSTRRLFLQKAALSIVAANCPLSAFCQKLLNSQTKGFEPETLVIFNGVSRQPFEPWIGSRFSVSQNNKSQGSLVLMSVDEIDTTGKEASDSTNTVRRVGAVPRPSKASAITSFSLRFQRPGTPLPQDTYMLAHDWLGTFPLFLVPSVLAGPTSTCTDVFTMLNQISLKKPE